MAHCERYVALAMQVTCRTVGAAAELEAARRSMRETIERIGAQLAASKAFIGPDLRLAVLPEYFLSGFPAGASTARWAELAGIDADGPEYAALGALARSTDVFLAGNAYERDPNFPGLYFQTSFVIAPSGTVVLRYRRLISMFGPSPYDVLDRYLAIYGSDSLFPVADIEIGRLAAIASEEILYPEIARACAVRGAEVFVHSSSEAASPGLTPKGVAKLARAHENIAYVVSANSAGMAGAAIPESSSAASSKIIDHRGLALVESGHGETMSAYAVIDLAALRAWRRRPSIANTLARLPMQAFASTYADVVIHPANGLTGAEGETLAPEPGFYRERQARVIERLSGLGVI